jgi:hypothetical protein
VTHPRPHHVADIRNPAVAVTAPRLKEPLPPGVAHAHLDLDNGTLRVRGTLARVGGALVVTDTETEKSRRTVPLSPAAVGILPDVRQRQRVEQLAAGSRWVKTPYVFTTEFGEPCDPRNALRALKMAAAKADLPGVGLHTLRHAAASVMLSNGVPLKVVSDMLGHASISITRGCLRARLPRRVPSRSGHVVSRSGRVTVVRTVVRPQKRPLPSSDVNAENGS